MKLSIINEAAGVLAGIKLNRITDKRVKEALLADYLKFRRLARQAAEDQQEIITKFQDDWKDELAPVEAFRQEGSPVVGHDAYLEAERDANKAIRDVFLREVDVDVDQVSLEDFLSSVPNEEITFAQVATLQDAGVLA